MWKRFAVSIPAAGHFAAQNLRLIHFCEHFTTDATGFFEQKETKATKGSHLLGCLHLLLLKFFPMAALMKNPESVKSVTSVVQFLWLRPCRVAPLRGGLRWKALVCGGLGPAQFPAFRGRANGGGGRGIGNHTNLYQVTRQSLPARCRAALRGINSTPKRRRSIKVKLKANQG